MIPVEHAVPAVGYVVTSETGKCFAFSGDCCENDVFWDGLNAKDDIELLIVECAYANHDKTLSKLARHYCSDSLAKDMLKFRHQPELYITHLKPGNEELIVGELSDLMPDRNPQVLKTGDRFTL